MKQKHSLAKELVQGALTRFSAQPRQEHEGDAQLIVLGAILEEVSNGRNGASGVTIVVGRKTLVGALALMGGFGTILAWLQGAF